MSIFLGIKESKQYYRMNNLDQSIDYAAIDKWISHTTAY